MDDRARSIVTDTSDNVYVVGSFYSSIITFGSTILTNAGGGNPDMFIAKYDNNGNVLWAKSAGGDGYDVAYSVATDASGYIYVVGSFASSTITFGSTTLTNAGLFIVKYDAIGNVIWAKSAGGGGLASSITIDVSGNIYVAGYFASSTITFGSTTLTNAGLFIVKYDAIGNVIWAKSAGGGGFASSITIDVSGNIYVAGYFPSSTITFGITTLTNANTGTQDMFLAKYNSNGNVLWAKSAGGTKSDVASSIRADASGNVYVVGNFLSSLITFGSITLTNSNPIYNDMFVVKYDANGNVLWAKRVGGNNQDNVFSVISDDFGYIYVVGSFASSSIIFDAITLTNNSTNNKNDIFIVKYNDNGNALWAKGGVNNNVSMAEISSVAIATSGDIYVGGWFYGYSISFGSTILYNVDSYDIFLAKLCEINQPTITPSGATSFCQGNNVILTASSGNTYSWSNSATTQSITVSSSSNYSVTVTNVNGCSATSSGTNVTVNPLPTVAITSSGSTTFCQGNSVTLTASLGNTYIWSNSATTQSITVSSSGSYSVTVTNTNGCSATSFGTNVIVNPLPTVTLALNPDTVCISAGSYILTGGSPNGGTYSGTGVSGGNFNPSVAGSGFHTITYTYTDANNCTNIGTAQLFVDLCTGVNQFLDSSLKFAIYPNPNTGTFTISTKEKEYSMSITSILGEKVYSSQINSGKAEMDGSTTLTINLSNYPNGIYFLQITTGSSTGLGGIARKKIVISR